jgi:hypothetical protein
MTSQPDYELETLLSLDGQEFRFARNYWIKIEAKRVAPTPGRPDGIKYSLTLHDPEGLRLYGIDNAHKARGRREFDHRHVYGARKVVSYVYRGAVALLEDFYREVERILHERSRS